MPIYEYVCQQCGHELDALQKIADAPLTDCEACGKPALKRKISAPSFRLKGQGWYETDFKGDKERKRNLADSADKPADKPADKAGDKKPESGGKAAGGTAKPASGDGGKAA